MGLLRVGKMTSNSYRVRAARVRCALNLLAPRATFDSRFGCPLVQAKARTFVCATSNLHLSPRGRTIPLSSFSSSSLVSISPTPLVSSLLVRAHVRAFVAMTPAAESGAKGKQGGEEDKGKGEEDKSRWKGDRGVAFWLFGVSGLVFGMVVIGGLTRLTKSGLSMVEWRLFGTRPPSTREEWEREFANYKKHPEYIKLNQGMSLDEFKFIFWWEYGHRMLGRCVGAAFLLPFLYFGARGRLSMPGLKPRLGLIGTLILGQGLVGWWMVKSGLEQHPDDYNIPRVSPYRLAAHLLSAFAIYTGLFTTALSVLPTRAVPFTATPPTLRLLAMGSSALVGLTVASGAFVAGNGAGLCYNEFPLMGGSFIPEDIIDPKLQPVWRNFFENSTLVQFDHRWLGMSTGAFIAGTYAFSRSLPASHPVRLPALALGCMAGVQVTLGITTLLTYVPIELASAHQTGALTLYTISLWMLHVISRGRGVTLSSSLPTTAAAATATTASTIQANAPSQTHKVATAAFSSGAFASGSKLGSACGRPGSRGLHTLTLKQQLPQQQLPLLRQLQLKQQVHAHACSHLRVRGVGSRGMFNTGMRTHL